MGVNMFSTLLDREFKDTRALVRLTKCTIDALDALYSENVTEFMQSFR